ncbi:MAG TPA: ABC transporter permease [Burkholderiaceae bacterium]|nr:ABC transporter permease [Burkholderiaceae bacterium]
MLKLILVRLASTIPVILVVTMLIFLLLRLSSGDPALLMAGDTASAEVIESMRISLGLDRPLTVQYGIWLSDLLKGDLGTSILTKQPVAAMIMERLEPTFLLTLSVICLTLLIAVPAGAIAAWFHRTWLDRSVMAFSVVGYSVPAFVIGYLLILSFAIYLNLLPVQGYVSPFTDFLGFVEHMTLPAVTLSIVMMALVARVTRSSLLEILGEDFIRTAKAKGNTDRRVLWKHALPNAAVPIITVIGISIASIIGGVVVTESVFNIPGVGRLTIDAIMSRDYPLVQGLILFFSLVYVGINLLVDLIYVLVDPRIRY